MDVYVSNVPDQSRNLKKFFKPYLERMAIWTFDCYKPPKKTYAILTFLSKADGARFLQVCGQLEFRASNQSTVSRPQILYIGTQRIYFRPGRGEAHPYKILCLQKAEEDRLSKAAKAIIHNPAFDYAPAANISFNCCSLSCGTWTYVGSSLAFNSEIRYVFQGVVKFTERAVSLVLSSEQHMDIPYSAVEMITTNIGQMPSLTFTLIEAPRFFQKPKQHSLVDQMQSLGLQDVKEFRTPDLGHGHQAFVGSCLVYRIELSDISSAELGGKLQTLERCRGVPSLVHYGTKMYQPREPWDTSFERLRGLLSGSSHKIPFPLAFQVQKLAQNGYLNPSRTISLLDEIEAMVQRSPVDVCVSAIRRLFYQIQYPGPEIESTDFDCKTLTKLIQDSENRAKAEFLTGDGTIPGMDSGNIAVIHRANVTPSGIHLMGPEPESNNRVLRKYSGLHDYFLRVQFCDEDGQPIFFSRNVSHDLIFNERFKSILQGGITIAERTFEFLGFSSSSLGAHCCWFVAPFTYKNQLQWNESIIRDLGNFTFIRSPAKCAARIGQVFSDTPDAVTLKVGVQQEIKDVQRNGRVFSDGVGTMSKAVMYKIWDKLRKTRATKPTCFQIRYSGAKGMISLDDRLKGEILNLRPSMIKFEGSTSLDIEVCGGAYTPLPMRLNRQLIKIMEDLGVSDQFFLRLQQEEVVRLKAITDSPYNASTFLTRQAVGSTFHLPWLIQQLTCYNLDFRADSFLSSVLELTMLIELRKLKHKANIPVSKGYHLHGIMDEMGILEEGQVFCIVLINNVSTPIIGKEMIISRAPALHPGDVQLVDAVAVPSDSPLRQLYNCIVFSQKGSRDLPSQLSGGDLDGDLYYIMWDPDAYIDRRNLATPADYPRATPIDIGRVIVPNDITDFFVKFMQSDQLGRIATLHQVLADQRDDGVFDADCLTLAELHSTAVDFAKTGIAPDMMQMPRNSPYRPDFTAPGPHVRFKKRSEITFDEEYLDDDDDIDGSYGNTGYMYYKSNKILGKLYRAIDERRVFRSLKRSDSAVKRAGNPSIIEVIWAYVRQRCQLFQWEHHRSNAEDIIHMYEESVLDIMHEYSQHSRRPISEVEVFIGNILGKTGAQTHRQRDDSTSMKEKFDRDTTHFIKCILHENDGSYSGEALERSIACLAVSLEEKQHVSKDHPVVSFKYIAAAVCLKELDKLPI